MKRFIVFFLGVIFSITIFLKIADAAMDYQLWDKVLKTYVDDNGRVAYAKLKENRRDLDVFVELLARADLSRFPEAEKKAFWINAYNAVTMKTIIDHYPVKSIRNIWRVWDTPKTIAGGQHTLNNVESTLRLQDPRVHFALNCASLGCPVLAREPFYPEKLDEQLDREAAQFMNNPQKVRLDRQNKVLYLSTLLTWYEKDFKTLSPDLITFIQKYINPQDREFLLENKVSTKGIVYDWNLNDRK